MAEKQKQRILCNSVYEIASTLASSINEDEVFNVIMGLVGEIFRPDNWSLFTYDSKEDKLVFKLVVGKEADNLIGKSFAADKGIAGHCLHKRETIVIPDAAKDKRMLRVVNEKSGFITKSIIAVPMYSKDKPMGVIELVNANEDCFAPDKIRLLEILADFASIAAQNAQYIKTIEEKATIDDCTDLHNARYMYTIIEKEISRYKRTGVPFSLVFFDLDHFKDVNDKYGHLIGSQLLREVADIIRKSIRPTDWGVRYGGDEFVLILQGAGLKDALIVTERIRKSINAKTFFVNEGYKIKIHASYGISTFPDDAGSVEGIIKAADNAMYKAKETGRNKICR
ncbi:MAG TPA: sensor domain-containing diguanylate cyclase [bacterium]|nr:sensor domain-containing diguanylate cyclase [bacterium]